MEIDLPFRSFGIKASHYIIGGMSIVAAMSWNAAVRSGIDTYFPPWSKNGVTANFVYAFVITLLLLIIIMMLPSTDSELPKQTQQNLAAAREREALQSRIRALENREERIERNNVALAAIFR